MGMRGEAARGGGANSSPSPSPSLEPTAKDWGSASSFLRHFARHPARREQGRIRGWRAGEVVEVVCYLKWAGRKRGQRERRGNDLFRQVVHRAGRPQDKGPEMAEDRWETMLGEALPGLGLNGPRQ